jgi:protein tyrosine phosphatase (PTP) superfamily phosphohydrolase (DUF442 family)
MARWTPLSLRAIAAGAVIGAVGVGLWAAAPGLRGDNLHPVIDGRVYRSGRLSAVRLEAAIDRYGFRTVINLTGDRTGVAWYDTERAVAARRDVAYHDIDMLATRLPAQPDVARLVDLLLRAPQPVLVHCDAGADRAGLASAIARLLLDAADLSDARTELSWRYGHWPVGPARELDRFLDQYQAALGASVTAANGRAFERWVRTGYVPYGYRAALSVTGLPAHIAPATSMVVRITAANRSTEPWRLSASRRTGVKVGFRIRRVGDNDWREFDRAVSTQGVVAPGEVLAVEHRMLAPDRPGRYQVKVDLVDEGRSWFEDQGSTPVVRSLAVRTGT